MKKTLEDNIYDRIVLLCETGDILLDKDDCEGAIQMYEKAWDILPEPKDDWEAATWILSAIGDAYFFLGKFKESLEEFSHAIICLNGMGNPYIHLRIGETSYELGDWGRAKDELTRAYMGGGRDLFENENPKYLSLLKSILLPPYGQNDL